MHCSRPKFCTCGPDFLLFECNRLPATLMPAVCNKLTLFQNKTSWVDYSTSVVYRQPQKNPQCISWCPSHVILVKMRCTQPLKVTSSQPLTQLAVLWTFRWLRVFRWSAPSLGNLHHHSSDSFTVVCFANAHRWKYYIVSVYDHHGPSDWSIMITLNGINTDQFKRYNISCILTQRDILH